MRTRLTLEFDPPLNITWLIALAKELLPHHKVLEAVNTSLRTCPKCGKIYNEDTQIHVCPTTQDKPKDLNESKEPHHD